MESILEQVDEETVDQETEPCEKMAKTCPHVTSPVSPAHPGRLGSPAPPAPSNRDALAAPPHAHLRHSQPSSVTYRQTNSFVFKTRPHSFQHQAPRRQLSRTVLCLQDLERLPRNPIASPVQPKLWRMGAGNRVGDVEAAEEDQRRHK